jgi:hypothetical protein
MPSVTINQNNVLRRRGICPAPTATTPRPTTLVVGQGRARDVRSAALRKPCDDGPGRKRSTGPLW